MEGEDVGVARRRAGAPLFESQVDDVDAGREDQQEAGDGVSGQAGGAGGAVAVLQKVVYIVGGRVQSGKRGGRGVD